MDVDIVAVGEVVVDDKVDTLEVHATTHDVRAYEHPHGPRPKPTHDCVTLHTTYSLLSTQQDGRHSKEFTPQQSSFDSQILPNTDWLWLVLQGVYNSWKYWKSSGT